MQVGNPELTLLLILVIVLFGGERVVRLLRELGQGARRFRAEVKKSEEDGAATMGTVQTSVDEKPTIHTAGGDYVGRDQNTANTGNLAHSVVNVGGEHTHVHTKTLARVFDKPFTFFVSTAATQAAERKAVAEAVEKLEGLAILIDEEDLIPSSARQPEQVIPLLQARDMFLLFACPPLEEAQIFEHNQARELHPKGRMYFAPILQVRETSAALSEPPEAITGYAEVDLLPIIIARRVMRYVEECVRASSGPTAAAQMSFLLALGEKLAMESDWLTDLRGWLMQAQPAEKAVTMPERIPAQVRGDEVPAESMPEKRPVQSDRLDFEPELVYIPPGPFWMGSEDADKDAYEHEKPYHPITLAGYWMGKYPVTVAQFEVFVKRTGHTTTAEICKSQYTWRTPCGEGSNVQDKAHHPVTCVSWEDALAYCRWLDQVTGRAYSLPSEAEWEKAARGTDSRIFPWGDHFDAAKCNTRGASPGDTTPVGQYSSRGGDSPYGCADMAGNVWEWTRSLWGRDWEKPEWPYPYDPRDSRREDLSADQNIHRVLRGGSWGFNVRLARCAYRYWRGPLLFNNNIGVRVVVCPSSTLGSDPLAL